MKLIISLFFIFLTAKLAAQDSLQQHYKIYDARTMQITTIDNIVNELTSADILFFGEEHNDSAGHYLENKIFRALHQRFGDQLALSLEMFETDNQLVLNEYLSGQIDESRFSKDARLWSNYKDYRPMIEFARQNKVSVIAANPPRRYVTMVSRRGMRALDSLSKSAKEFLPRLPYDTLSGRYREKFYDIMKGSPGGDNPRVYYSQTLWDAGMANSIHLFLKKNKGKKVFHCVGKFHVEEKLGTAAQLQIRDKKLKLLTIICFPDKSFSSSSWDQFANLGDYIIITNPDLKRTY